MRYTEPADVEYPSAYDPEGDCIDGYVTAEVPDGDLFGRAIRQLVLKVTGRNEYMRVDRVLMTTVAHWSGYSEYTVTNQWSQIVLTVPDWNFEREWPSLGDFLRAMADANPEADR